MAKSPPEDLLNLAQNLSDEKKSGLCFFAKIAFA
jgi:hypothetical protein